MAAGRARWLAFSLALCGCGQLLGLDHDARRISLQEAEAACGSCDDGNPCTVDVCDTEAEICRHEPAADGLAVAQTPGDCAENWCVAGQLERRADDADVPNPVFPNLGSECAIGSCRDGSAEQSVKPAGAACAQGGGHVCDGAGRCVACLADADCVAPDRCGAVKPGFCGCEPRTCGALGLTCGSAPDGCGGTLDCDHGVVSGKETDVDCGGPVASCATRCQQGQSCLDGSDCDSGFCAAARCHAPWSDAVTGGQDAGAARIAVGPDGSALVAGSYHGSLQLGATQLAAAQGQSIYLLKLSPAGQLVWSRALGSGSPTVTGLAVDSAGNIVLAGWLQGELDVDHAMTTAVPRGFVAKLDEKGDPLWADWLCTDAACAGSGFSKVSAIALDASDRIAVAGNYAGPLGVSSGASSIDPGLSLGAGDGFAMRLDTAGGVDWAIELTDPGLVSPTAVAASAGRVWIGGDFQGTLGLGGPQGGALLTSQGGLDIFLVGLDDTGHGALARGFGDPGSPFQQHLAALAMDSAGDVLLAGDLSGAVDFGAGAIASKGETDAFIAKLSGAGQCQWAHAYGDPKSQHAAGLALDGQGNAFVIGSFEGTVPMGPTVLVSNGAFDVMAFEVDPHGAVTYAAGYGDPANQLGRAIAAIGYGGLLLAGDFSGSIDFGGAQLVAGAKTAAFVAAIAP